MAYTPFGQNQCQQRDDTTLDKALSKTGNNLESLYPRTRKDLGKHRALDEETCLGLIRLREEMPDVSVPLL